MVSFLNFIYGFTVTLHTSVRFEQRKLKNKQTKKINKHIFCKIVSAIALQICKNCYLRQGKGKRIENNKNEST